MAVKAAKQRTLLAALLLSAGRVVGVDELVDRLWGECPPLGARDTLRSYVLRLRRSLDVDGSAGHEVVRTHPEGYLIEADRERFDVHVFEDLLADAAGSAGRDTRAEYDSLCAALRLWRGPALADVPSESLHRDHVPTLEEHRLRATERRIDIELYRGAGAEAVAELLGLTSEHPLRERFWSQLMLAQYRGGQQAEALDTFRRVSEHLSEELGVDPGPELQRLHQAILRHEVEEPGGTGGPGGIADERETATAGVRPPGQLPRGIPDFVGRAQTVEELSALIGRGGETEVPPLVVVSGGPGIGKTTLAVHVAHMLRSRFPDGQLYVDLRGYASTPPVSVSQVMERFLRALGAPPGDIPSEPDAQEVMYRTFLADRRVLVLLDNAADAEQVRPLLPGTSGSAVMVTSRNSLLALALHGAARMPLGPLEHRDAVRFLQLSMGDRDGARDRTAVTGLAELAELCARSPLALRVATANLESGRELEGFLEELRRGNRLSGLSLDGNAAVRAAFDLSYAALTPDEKTVFALLGLAPGPGIRSESTAALAGYTTVRAREALKGLATRNLLEHRGDGGYRSHDLLREYAAERAVAELPGDARSLALRRLFDHYLARADEAGRSLHVNFHRMRRPDSREGHFASTEEATAWLDEERANVLAAVQYAAEYGPHEIAWHLADALRPYLWVRLATADSVAVCEAGLRAARTAGHGEAEATMLYALGTAWWVAGDHHRSKELLEGARAAFRRAGAVSGEIAALANLGGCEGHTGRMDAASEYYADALRLSEESGETQLIVTLHSNLGAVHEGIDLRSARRHLTLALRYRRDGHPGHLGLVLENLASVACSSGDFDGALRYAEEARESFRATGEDHRVIQVLLDIARVHYQRGSLLSAARLAHSAHERSVAVGKRMGEIDSLRVLGEVERRAGSSKAVELLERALEDAREVGYMEGEITARVGLSRAHLENSETERARVHADRARDLSVATQRRVLEGDAQTVLAAIDHECGHHRAAVARGEEACETHRRTGARAGEATALRVQSMAWRALGDSARAEGLLARAMDMEVRMGIRKADGVQ